MDLLNDGAENFSDRRADDMLLWGRQTRQYLVTVSADL
jgi:hypothetical protein